MMLDCIPPEIRVLVVFFPEQRDAVRCRWVACLTCILHLLGGNDYC
jgi:hypothetical protein